MQVEVGRGLSALAREQPVLFFGIAGRYLQKVFPCHGEWLQAESQLYVARGK